MQLKIMSAGASVHGLNVFKSRVLEKKSVSKNASVVFIFTSFSPGMTMEEKRNSYKVRTTQKPDIFIFII